MENDLDVVVSMIVGGTPKWWFHGGIDIGLISGLMMVCQK